MKLADEECEEISLKIDNERFDYYFCDYSPDRRLEDLVGKEIDLCIETRKVLASELMKQGIDINI